MDIFIDDCSTGEIFMLLMKGIAVASISRRTGLDLDAGSFNLAFL